MNKSPYYFGPTTGIIDKLRGSRNGPKRGEDPAFMVNAAGTEYDKKNDITVTGELLGGVNALQNFYVLRCLEKIAALAAPLGGPLGKPADIKRIEELRRRPRLTPEPPAPPEAPITGRRYANLEEIKPGTSAWRLSGILQKGKAALREPKEPIRVIPKQDFAQRVHAETAGTEQAVEPGTAGAVKTRVYAPALQRIVERLKHGPQQREGYVKRQVEEIPQKAMKPGESPISASERLRDLAQMSKKDMTKEQRAELKAFGNLVKSRRPLGAPSVPLVGGALRNIEYGGRLAGRTIHKGARGVWEGLSGIGRGIARPFSAARMKVQRVLGGKPELEVAERLSTPGGAKATDVGLGGLKEQQTKQQIADVTEKGERDVGETRARLIRAYGALIKMHGGPSTDEAGKPVSLESRIESASKRLHEHYPAFKQMAAHLNLSDEEKARALGFEGFTARKDPSTGKIVSAEEQLADHLSSFERAHGEHKKLLDEAAAGKKTQKEFQKGMVAAGKEKAPTPEKKPAAADAGTPNVFQKRVPREGLSGAPAEAPEEALRKMWGLGGAAEPAAPPSVPPAASAKAPAPEVAAAKPPDVLAPAASGSPRAGIEAALARAIQVGDQKAINKLKNERKVALRQEAAFPAGGVPSGTPTGTQAAGTEINIGAGGEFSFKRPAGGAPQGVPFAMGETSAVKGRRVDEGKLEELLSVDTGPKGAGRPGAEPGKVLPPGQPLPENADFVNYKTWERNVKDKIPGFKATNPEHFEAAWRAVPPTPQQQATLNKVLNQEVITPSKMQMATGTPGVKASPHPPTSQGVAAAAASGDPQNLGNTINNAANDVMARVGMDPTGQRSVLSSGSPQLSQEDIDSIKYISRQRNLAQHPEVLDQFFAKFGGSRPPSPLIQGLISTGGMLAGMSMMEAAGFTGALPQLMAMGLGPAVASWLAEKFGYGSDKYNQIVEAYLSGKTPQSLAESYQQPQGMGTKVKNFANRVLGRGQAAPAAPAPAPA